MFQKKCVECGKNPKWIGCTPSGEKYICSSAVCESVTFIFMEVHEPVASVTLCEQCGKDVSGRAGKIYCSNKCRQKMYRAMRNAQV